MTLFSEVMADLAEDGAAEVTADWMQGRTTYGGMSSALLAAAAEAAIPELPPLRTAQFMLIGPAGGRLSTKVEVLRRGKSTTVVQADLLAEDGALAARALLAYGAGRESAVTIAAAPAPQVPAPEDCEDFFAGRRGPEFAGQFEVKIAGGARVLQPDGEPTLLVWARHRDRAAGAGAPALLALADVLPPAAAVRFTRWAPISTLSWSVDVLDPAPTTEDGWWLVRSAAESADGGWSPQAMMVWDRGGRAVMSSRQMVALFG